MEKSWSQSCCPAEASLPRLPCWLLPAQPLGVIRQSQLGLGAQHGLHRPAEGRGQVRALTTVWAPCQGRSGCWTRAPARSGAWVGGLSWQRPRGVRRTHCLCRAPRAGEALPGFLPTHPAVRGTRRRPRLTPCGPGSLRELPRASGPAREPACPSTCRFPRDCAHAAPRAATWLGGRVGPGAPRSVRAPARQGRTRADLFAARPPPPRSLCGLEPAGGSGGTGASPGPSAPPTTRAPIGCPGRWAWPRRDRPELALPRGQER